MVFSSSSNILALYKNDIYGEAIEGALSTWALVWGPMNVVLVFVGVRFFVSIATYAFFEGEHWG